MSEPNEVYNEDMIQIMIDANKRSMISQSPQIEDDNFGAFGRRRRHGIIYKVIGGLAFIGIVGFGLFYVDNSAHLFGANPMDYEQAQLIVGANQEGRDLSASPTIISSASKQPTRQKKTAFEYGLMGKTETMEMAKRSKKQDTINEQIRASPDEYEKGQEMRKKMIEEGEKHYSDMIESPTSMANHASKIMEKWRRENKKTPIEHLKFEQMMKGYFNAMARDYGNKEIPIDKMEKQAKKLADELEKLRKGFFNKDATRQGMKANHWTGRQESKEDIKTREPVQNQKLKFDLSQNSHREADEGRDEKEKQKEEGNEMESEDESEDDKGKPRIKRKASINDPMGWHRRRPRLRQEDRK